MQNLGNVGQDREGVPGNVGQNGEGGINRDGCACKCLCFCMGS
jgi:hypothetical protein